MCRPSEVDDLPLALSVKTVARLADVSTDSVYEAIAAGTCPWPVLRVGRTIRIPRASVLASLRLDVGTEQPPGAGEPGAHCACGLDAAEKSQP